MKDEKGCVGLDFSISGLADYCRVHNKSVLVNNGKCCGLLAVKR